MTPLFASKLGLHEVNFMEKRHDQIRLSLLGHRGGERGLEPHRIPGGMVL